MKLDEFPEYIDCKGWRRKLVFGGLDHANNPIMEYRCVEKLHVQPTMREVMEHLCRGGWVKQVFRYSDTTVFYRLNGDLEIHDSLSKKEYWRGLSPEGRSNLLDPLGEQHLIPAGEWGES